MPACHGATIRCSERAEAWTGGTDALLAVTAEAGPAAHSKDLQDFWLGAFAHQDPELWTDLFKTTLGIFLEFSRRVQST
jgi:hypothetical protein